MVNKFDRLVPKDWSWHTAIPKLPELDVKGLEEVVSQNQQRIDQAQLISEKNANALQTPEDLALNKALKEDTQKALDEVSNAYMQGVTQGNMAYKNYLSQLRKDWSTGGRADVLNTRYAGYQNALKQIDEYYKDDPSPVNKTLAKKQLQDKLNAGVGYNPETGAYNQIGTPELYKNPNINDAVNKMLAEIKANGDTQFLGDELKSWYIKKIQTETREPERIRLAYEALSKQPEYAAQIQRDAEYKAMTIDPEKHKAAFEETQKGSLDQLNKQAEVAKKDTQSTKDWQNFLRSQGYNVNPDGSFGDLTKKATEDFLSKKKEQVDANLKDYNFKNQMLKEANDSYLNYALRGAYKKNEATLTFNSVKKTLGDWALKKEENQISMWRAQQEFAPKDAASTTAVSGTAMKLPEIQTYYKETKEKEKQVEQQVSTALKNSKAFNGWTPENVAQAYGAWEKVKGNSPEEQKAAYKAELAKISTYPFSDKQIDLLYEEMNGVAPGEVKTALDALGSVRSDVQNVENVQKSLGSQFIKTPEGKKEFAKLSGFRRPGESDVDLVNRALTNPESFKVNSRAEQIAATGKVPNSREMFLPDEALLNTVGYNSADEFKNAMQRSTEDKNNKYDWGSFGTIEVYANNDDKVLKPVMDGIAQGLETGTGLNYATFNAAGLVVKNAKGETIDPGKSRKVEQMGVAVDNNNNPILKVAMTVDAVHGGKYLGYTDLQLVPGSVEHAQVLNGMKKAYVQKFQDDPVTAQGYLSIIDALNGVDAKSRTAKGIRAEKLDLTNTVPEDIFMKDVNGNIFNAKNQGWQVQNLESTENANGYTWELWGVTTPTGNASINTFMDAKGKRWIAPSVTGEYLHKNPDAALKDREAKKILAATPIEVNEQKVHTGGSGTTVETKSKTTEITKTTEQE